ncbi:hypothetical protein BH10CHL1_BH10CHL1_18030 [soil metagenome]
MIDKDKDRLRRLIWINAKYKPTEGPDSQTQFHANPALLKLVAGGIRAGKSKSTAMEMIAECAVANGLIWIVGPDYEQCKPEFEYMFAPLKALGLVAKESRPEKGSRSFELVNGCRVQTKSSDDADSLASFAPHALLMVEAGQQTLETYLKIIERGLEHNAKIILSGTFEKADTWYAELWEKWQGVNAEGGCSFSLPSWSNTKLFPGGRNDYKIKRLEDTMPEELFMERCGAIPYKPAGLVFRKFERSRKSADVTIQLPWHVRNIDFNPDWPIELAVDPATHTYAVLAIQWRGPKVRVIDEIYMHNAIAQNVIPEVMARPWWPYIKSNAGVMDTAGKQRHGNKSNMDIWADLAGKYFRSNYVLINESIDAVRLRLEKLDEDGDPLLQFDYRMKSSKAANGKANGILAEMGLYKYREFREGSNVSKTPIDANNDSAKALGYWLFDIFGPVVERRTNKVRVLNTPHWLDKIENAYGY